MHVFRLSHKQRHVWKNNRYSINTIIKENVFCSVLLNTEKIPYDRAITLRERVFYSGWSREKKKWVRGPTLGLEKGSWGHSLLFQTHRQGGWTLLCREWEGQGERERTWEAGEWGGGGGRAWRSAGRGHPAFNVSFEGGAGVSGIGSALDLKSEESRLESGLGLY